MTLVVEQSTAFEANVEIGTSGLVGTLEVAVVDNDGATVTGPTTANITENVVGGIPTGNYSWNNPAAPATIGQYQVLWSSDGTFDPETMASEDLVVVTQSTDAVLPAIPPPAEGGQSSGPCTAWTDEDAVADCCSVETSSSAIFADVITPASELMFELSGRLYAGLCSKTVRPGCDSCYCGYQVLSRGHIIGPWDYGYPFAGLCDSCLVACSPSRIKLSGYPVREITEIKIDGDVLDPSSYTLWKSRYVTRLDNGRWPHQQNLTYPDTEDNTFSITYTYGMSPPVSGQNAAAQLACELYKACSDATSGDCVLPIGVTRVTRQGITIDKQAFTSWGYIGKNNRGFAPGWKTGLPLVDAFLNAYNRQGLMRRPTFWSPGKHQYAQEFG